MNHSPSSPFISTFLGKVVTYKANNCSSIQNIHRPSQSTSYQLSCSCGDAPNHYSNQPSDHIPPPWSSLDTISQSLPCRPTIPSLITHYSIPNNTTKSWDNYNYYEWCQCCNCQQWSRNGNDQVPQLPWMSMNVQPDDLSDIDIWISMSIIIFWYPNAQEI